MLGRRAGAGARTMQEADASGDQRAAPASMDGVAVRAQLARVLSDPSFQAAPQLTRLLQHLVESALAGDTREVKETALGAELFGRGTDFDPKIHNIVRAHAHRLRRRLEDYFSGPGRDDPIVIDIPKGHYVAKF